MSDKKYETGKIEDLYGPPMDGPGVLKGYRQPLFHTVQIPLKAIKELQTLREALVEIKAIAELQGNDDKAAKIVAIAQKALEETK